MLSNSFRHESYLVAQDEEAAAAAGEQSKSMIPLRCKFTPETPEAMKH